MEFYPRRTIGTLLGSLVAAWAFLLTALLIVWGLDQPVSLSALGFYLTAALLFGLGCLFTFWTYGCSTLRYVVDRNGLAIHWGPVRQMIPLDKIERLVPGRPGLTPRVQGVSWLGHHVGRAWVERIGDTLFYSTHHAPEELLYIVTPSQAYAVSVQDSVRFGAEVQARQNEGVAAPLRQAPRRAALAAHPFWSDRFAQLLALAAIAVCAATFGLILSRYPNLPESLPISFPPLEVTRVASKEELLTLPTTAFGLLLINLILAFLLHAWERMMAHLLLVVLIALQIVFLVGAAIAVS
jgi:hypothetical protein